jgi:hypothetical protein
VCVLLTDRLPRSAFPVSTTASVGWRRPLTPIDSSAVIAKAEHRAGLDNGSRSAVNQTGGSSRHFDRCAALARQLIVFQGDSLFGRAQRVRCVVLGLKYRSVIWLLAEVGNTTPLRIRALPGDSLMCPFRKSYPDVMVVQPRQDWDGDNDTAPLDRPTQGRILAQGQVRAHLIVIRRIRSKNSSQMRLAKDQQPVQALASHGANQTLHIRILPWRSRRDRSVADSRSIASIRSRHFCA